MEPEQARKRQLRIFSYAGLNAPLNESLEGQVTTDAPSSVGDASFVLNLLQST